MKEQILNPKIRAIIDYLNTFKYAPRSPVKRREIEDKIKSMGAKYFCRGGFSRVFRLGKYVIKISIENFNKIRPIVNHEIFKKFVAPVYWIHEKGFALIGKLIEPYDEDYWWLSNVIKKIRGQFKEIGFGIRDVRSCNIVRHEDGPIILDYGCLFKLRKRQQKP